VRLGTAARRLLAPLSRQRQHRQDQPELSLLLGGPSNDIGAITGCCRSPKAGSATIGCGIKKLAFALSLACLFAPASVRAQNAYITNSGDDTVSVIDTTTDTVVGAPIPVGVDPSGVAVTPDGSKVYVVNCAGGPFPAASR